MTNHQVQPDLDQMDEATIDAYEAEPTAQTDGSYLLDLSEAEAAQAPPQGFDDNLAEQLPEPELNRLATDLLELLELDKKSQEHADRLYADGLKRTGLSDDLVTGEAFEGASRAVHPMLMEACVDFSARAIKELFPSQGPVKIAAEGIKTRADAKKADAKRRVLNWQLTEQIEEYYPELQRGLSQTPLGGSQYLKLYPDLTLGRTVAQYVPSDKMLMPYAAASFSTAERRTHILELTRVELDQRMAAAVYREVDVAEPGQTEATTEPARVTEQVQGRTPDGENKDGLRVVYEVDVFWVLKGDQLAKSTLPAPYIITIDEYSQKVLAIRRNWAPDDTLQQRLDWFVELPFIPWRGSKSIGLYHIIGGLAIAATGALRSLLDAALINNLPVLFKLKGAKLNGQTVTVDGLRIVELEGPTGVADIRDVLMPQPFNPPSQVLYQLLEWLTNHARQTIGTAAERIADQRQDMPVGTVLALIEEGSHPTSAIHQGLHRAQAKALKILCRINATTLSNELLQERFPDDRLRPQDFADDTALVPVSDPHIFSTAQRTAQLQAVMQLAQGAPQLYDAYWLHRRALEQLKVTDIDQVLPPPKAPKELNPVAENLAMLMQRPVAAFPDQDHLAHLAVHAAFVLDQSTGGSPLLLPRMVGQMLEHLTQHIGMLYAQTYNTVVSQATEGVELSELMKDKQLYPEIDKTLAVAAEKAHARLAQQLAPYTPVFQHLMQVAQQLAPKPQPDPASQVALQLGTMEAQRRAQQDQVNNQLAQQREQLAQVKEQFDQALKAQVHEREAQRADAALALKADAQAKTHALNQAELRLKAMTGMQAAEMARLTHELAVATAEHQQAMAQLDARITQQLKQDELAMDAHYQALRAATEQRYKDTQNLVSYLKNEADNATKERIEQQRLMLDAAAGAEGATLNEGLTRVVAQVLQDLAQSQQTLQAHLEAQLGAGKAP